MVSHLLLLSWLFYYNKRHNWNGTGKSWKSWLLSVPFWLCLSFLSGANTVEAGNPGIPRSINMGICVRLCSDWCLREADILSDYPQTSVSCIVRTQYPYFAQRYAGISGFGPILVLLLNFYSVNCSASIMEVYQRIWLRNLFRRTEVSAFPFPSSKKFSLLSTKI